MISKCKQDLNLVPDFNNADLNCLNSNIELVLIQHLGRLGNLFLLKQNQWTHSFKIRYGDVLWKSYQEYEPYHVVQYLFQLVRLTNLCMNENYVIGENEKTAQVINSLCFV